MTLYDIDESIMNCVDEETGEIVDPEKLDQLQIERDRKCENVGLWIKDLGAEADALSNEIKALTARKKAAESKSESLKKWLQNALSGQKFKTARLSVSYRSSKSVKITDADKIPEEFLVAQPPKVSKTELKKKLVNGDQIPGAELVINTNMQIK